MPRRLVDAGKRAHVDGAAAVEAAAIHDVPVVLDQEWILADQVVGKLVHAGFHRQSPALDHRLAPADHALIGLDFQKQPARPERYRWSVS
jgi:thiamine monophosphate synthase